MRRSVLFALLSLLALGALLRLLPLASYLYWGADVGEYYTLARALVVAGRLPIRYTGWGVAYPDFPGMEALAGAAAFAGLPLEASLLLLAPLLASLATAALFLVATEVTGDDRAGLVAAAFVATAMPHVYPTAHGIPGAVGDLLFASTLLLVLRARRDRRWFALLAPVLGAAIVVHHFSAYLTLVALAFVVVARLAYRRQASPRGTRPLLALVLLLTAATGAYWYLYAHRFRDEVLTDAGRLPPWVAAAGLASIPGGLLLLAALRPRLPWEARPAYPPWRYTGLALGAALAFLGGSAVAYVLLPVPGTSIRLPPAAALLFAPLLGLASLAAAGRRPCAFLPGGIALTGCLAGLVASLVVGALGAPRALIPYRHVEFIVVPAALFVGAGVVHLLDQAPWGARGRRAFVLLLALLLAGTIASAQPPREALGGAFEGYYPSTLDAVHWASGRVDGVVASDHRLSSVLFGFGSLNATWENVDATLHAPTFAAAREEMAAVRLQVGTCRVDYVALDGDVVAGALLNPFDPARPLSPEAQAKFAGSPYLLVYDDGYSQVYWVNWGLVPPAPPPGCQPPP